MPRYGMYKCNWTEAGIFNFSGIENGYADLFNRLDDYFHMDETIDPSDDVISYYDRLSEDLMGIGSQIDFETALMHSSQSYSPFSLVVKVNAIRRAEHWFNGEKSVAFGTAWRRSKPKFTCIRKWLISLEESGSVCNDLISDSIPYAEKAFLYSQFKVKGQSDYLEGSKYSTNQKDSLTGMSQSNLPKNTLKSIKATDSVFELIDSSNDQQKMLHAKMMMDPVISMILFNEYIPLRRPGETKQKEKCSEKLVEEMGGLFLGKMEEEEEEKPKGCKLFDKSVNVTSVNLNSGNAATSSGGLFIRSEFSPPASVPSSGGLFIRSEDSSVVSDDWIIA